MAERICNEGHIIDEGKDVCQRCGALEKKIEQTVAPKPSEPIAKDESVNAGSQDAQGSDESGTVEKPKTKRVSKKVKPK